MILRKYDPEDCPEMAHLFYQTVHKVNAKDYTKEQLDAWAPEKTDIKKWGASFLQHFTVVACENGVIAGFGDIDQSGYLDRLYVHCDYQRKSVASQICNALESAVEGDIITHASITALPFFEKRGYAVVKKQSVERQGVLLTNYVMIKKR